ncbi:hypothetical protein GCM10012286_57000 [Streptomyces lasiicapitis]|uniref:Uncharacterized protein n=1 Tax=Streptomyces lasiicapitis TaxID=1923961 RepID=A0ABQ2MJ51_9ACTN|nr:hypothetical protein GCM10012286_57000 [Streptomyces lasiicapitis]
MTPRTRTNLPPHLATIPAGFNAWLLDCAPVAYCGVCAALWQQRAEAISRDDLGAAVKASTEIRDHASGAHDDRAVDRECLC